MSFYCYLCSYVFRSFLTYLPAAVAAMHRAHDSVCIAVYDCDARLGVSHPRGRGSRKLWDRRTVRNWCSRSQVRCQLTCLAASHALSTDRFLPLRQQAGPLGILIEASRPYPTVSFSFSENLEKRSSRPRSCLLSLCTRTSISTHVPNLIRRLAEQEVRYH